VTWAIPTKLISLFVLREDGQSTCAGFFGGVIGRTRSSATAHAPAIQASISLKCTVRSDTNGRKLSNPVGPLTGFKSEKRNSPGSDSLTMTAICPILISLLLRRRCKRVSELFSRVSDQYLQFFGEYGHIAEYPISRFWTDSRALRLYGGTSEVMKELVVHSRPSGPHWLTRCAITQQTLHMIEIKGPDLCHCLAARRAARHMTRLYDRQLASAGLSTTQFSLLALVETHPGISVPDLAVRMVMERTTLLRAIKPMREQGWLLSEAQGAKFALAFTVSETGAAKLREAEPYWKAAQKELEAQAGRQRAVQLRNELLDFVFAA